jgi:hypothetical protein
MKGGLITIVTFIFLRETHAATILKRKAHRLRKLHPTLIFIAEGVPTESTRVMFTRAFTRPMKMLFTSPIVFSLALYTLCF